MHQILLGFIDNYRLNIYKKIFNKRGYKIRINLRTTLSKTLGKMFEMKTI